MKIESSNMTHEEYFRLNSILSIERTEQVLHALQEAQALDVREYAAYTQEARSGFASEDFLVPEVILLRHLAKHLRGDNKQDLLVIIEVIENELQQLQSGTEYANDQLSNIVRTVTK